MDTLQQQLESILLFKGQPVSYIELSKLLETSVEDIKTQVKELSSQYESKGIQIIYSETQCELVTSPQTSETIAKLQKQESENELSNAALETLSIVLYMGPIARSSIDFIRGVNSQFTLRSLLIRGLIERTATGATPLYQATLDTIKFLGLNKSDELPNFEEIKLELNQFIKDNSNNESK